MATKNKRITIALDYEYLIILDKFKKSFKVKQNSQVFRYLLDLYSSFYSFEEDDLISYMRAKNKKINK